MDVGKMYVRYAFDSVLKWIHGYDTDVPDLLHSNPLSLTTDVGKVSVFSSSFILFTFHNSNSLKDIIVRVCLPLSYTVVKHRRVSPYK